MTTIRTQDPRIEQALHALAREVTLELMEELGVEVPALRRYHTQHDSLGSFGREDLLKRARGEARRLCRRGSGLLWMGKELLLWATASPCKFTRWDKYDSPLWATGFGAAKNVIVLAAQYRGHREVQVADTAWGGLPHAEWEAAQEAAFKKHLEPLEARVGRVMLSAYYEESYARG